MLSNQIIMIKHFSILLFFLFLCISVSAQERIGINTSNPVMPLELYGSADQFLRVQSGLNVGVAGIELMRGDDNFAANDWRITNDGGALKFAVSSNGFGFTEELIRIRLILQVDLGSEEVEISS